MKNSKEYARKLQKYYRGLKRSHAKIQEPSYEEPAEAVVHAIVSEKTTEASAQTGRKRFSEYFVDLNDLRVSRTEEIVELLGEDTAVTKSIAVSLTRVLMAIFNEYHTLNLQGLKKMGKRPAKQALERLDGISHFVVNYCMLVGLQAHAIPLTERMAEHLKRLELVDPDADEQQIEGFLTRQVSAKNAYEFYALLRHESESHRVRKKKTKGPTKRARTTRRTGRTKVKTK